MLTALPFVGASIPTAEAEASRSAYPGGPEPTPLDDGEDGPPRPVRVLDPADPVAAELARLYDTLRASHEAEIRAKRTYHEHDNFGGACPEMEPADWIAYCDESHRLTKLADLASIPRRNVYFALIRAVIVAHGGGNPWLSEWYRYGTAHRVVRVGDRVYSVCSDYDADWPENQQEGDDDEGSVVLSVIDL